MLWKAVSSSNNTRYGNETRGLEDSVLSRWCWELQGGERLGQPILSHRCAARAPLFLAWQSPHHTEGKNR